MTYSSSEIIAMCAAGGISLFGLYVLVLTVLNGFKGKKKQESDSIEDELLYHIANGTISSKEFYENLDMIKYERKQKKAAKKRELQNLEQLQEREGELSLADLPAELGALSLTETVAVGEVGLVKEADEPRLPPEKVEDKPKRRSILQRKREQDK